MNKREAKKVLEMIRIISAIKSGSRFSKRMLWSRLDGLHRTLQSMYLNSTHRT